MIQKQTHILREQSSWRQRVAASGQPMSKIGPQNGNNNKKKFLVLSNFMICWSWNILLHTWNLSNIVTSDNLEKNN